MHFLPFVIKMFINVLLPKNKDVKLLYLDENVANINLLCFIHL